MTLKIGEKIKELREKSNITQQKMADYLGITEQAISRWENSGGYPDMELIPSIANFLNVSTDELFETDKKHEKLVNLHKEVRKKVVGWDSQSNCTAIEMYRDILKEFPNDYQTMFFLIAHLSEENHGISKGKHSAEIISYCNRIINDSNDMNLRRIAINSMARAYKVMGENERAIKIIKENPFMYTISEGIFHSLESNMLGIAEGDEKNDNYKKIINTLFLNMCRLIRDFSNDDFSENTTDETTLKRNIMLREKINTFTKIFYEENDFGFHHELMLYNYYELAEYYILLGNCKKTLETIEKCAKTAIYFDTDKESVYSSILAKNCRKDGDYSLANHENAEENIVYNQSYRLINFWLTSNGKFKSIYNNNKFKVIIAELEKYAKVEKKMK